jgi:glucose-6-phosphate dehydrogenase assembly protein OpcA
MRAAGSGVRRLSSIVVPLLVPDLPVFLWWRGGLSRDKELLIDLLEAADRWIIDSSHFLDFRKACDCLKARTDTVYALSDLNWSRLTSWRSAIASMFDYSSTRSHLDRLKSVEIIGSLKSAHPWLIASWLCSRLKLALVSNLSQSSGANTFQCKGEGDEIVVAIREPESPGSELTSVHFVSHENGEFKVELTPDGKHLRVGIRIDGRGFADSMDKLIEESESDLLRRELQILGRDRSYEEALGFLQLLK